MYAAADPRSALVGTSTATGSRVDDRIATPEIVEFGLHQPAEVSEDGACTWYLRAQSLVLAHTEASPGTVLSRPGDASEHVVLLPHETSSVRVRAGEDDVHLGGQGLVVVPPGESEVILESGTALVRLFDPGSPGVALAALNAASYLEPHPRVRTEAPWPEPVGGYGLRAYPVGGIPRSADRFGRIFRTRSFMVNFLFPHEGPRDPGALSPHHHDDFEQVSLAVSGRFVHHIRTPWGTDRTRWRDDVHTEVGSPSVAVIPPPTVHTSEAVGPGTNQLVDIFAPPRRDFSAKPGWVLNADTYPEP